ncbi:MAG TPA: FAD-dependent oxidoreductase, partial [Streptosporangiaceae bacterium]
MTAHSAYVIVGASLAGAKAAETLRAEGFDGPVVLIGAESERPYERPPLSKEYLLGKAERDSIYVHPPQWYEQNNVELRLNTTVTSIDRAAHQLTLADGGTQSYAKLLLTTGSSPRRIQVPGAGLEGVYYLRTATDSDRIKAAFQAAKRVVVIGAGWIGLETAAAARTAGADVTVAEMAELPLLRVLGSEVAQVFADLHRDHGVDLKLGVGVDDITGTGRVNGVRLVDGTHIPAEAVVVGVGVMPNTHLAEAAGLEIEDGIEVDASLRTS